MFGSTNYNLLKRLASQAGGNPTFGDTAYILSKKILQGMGGQKQYSQGDGLLRIWQKILFNQGGPRFPKQNDTLNKTLQKAALNKGFRDSQVCADYYYLRFLISTGGVVVPDWILDTGKWDDSAQWLDYKTWND